MSIGIDIGTSYCVLATIERGAVSIVRNDLSERLTPALVSFTENERLIGEAAATQIRSNFTNTARNIKQLLGASKSQPDCLENESKYSLAPLAYTDDSESALAGYKVTYKGKEQIFTATRCMAALLTKLTQIAEKAIGVPVKDVVISVPAWYSEQSRQAMLDAAEIAGLNCLKAMNEHAAVALDYGINRSKTFDAEKPSRVAFVGIGHGSANIFVAEFVKGELRMIAVSSDKTSGGRDFDQAILEHFAEIFKKKYSVNPLTSAKAVLKMEDVATKAKKTLSANLEAPFNMECLIDDYDLNGLLTRDQFETLCEPFRIKLNNLLKSTFEQNNISPDSIDHVEIIGGCTRIPWIQKTITDFFNNRLPLSKTLNMDETVARGCALQAAMLNPRFKVRDFAVCDRSFEPVFVSYFNSENELKSSTFFEKGSILGTSKYLTFQRSTGFDIQLSSSGQPLLTTVGVPEVNFDLSIPRRFKFRATLSPNGICYWESLQFLIDEEVEELVKEKKQIEAATPVEGQEASAEKQFEEIEVLKKKVKTHRFDCPHVSHSREGFLKREVKVQLREKELIMAADDRAQQETKEMMNSLEAYVYSLRNRIQSNLKDFATSSEIEIIQQKLNETEDWIYDNLEGTKDLYESKLKELQTLGNPIEWRRCEFDARKEAISRLLSSLSELRATESSPSWSHIEKEKMMSLVEKVNETERWINSIVTQFNSKPLSADPICKAKEIFDQTEMIINFSKTILTAKVIPSQETASADASTTAAATEDTPMEGTSDEATMES